MKTYNDIVNTIVASEEAEKSRYLNNFDQTDAPLVIESLSRNNPAIFRFHTILRDIVRTDPQKEDILKDPGIIDILKNKRIENIGERVCDILETMINDNAVDFVLEHETNSWDDQLSEQIRAYALRYSRKEDRDVVEGLARCIAYSVDMEVVVKPFKWLQPSKRKRRSNLELDE